MNSTLGSVVPLAMFILTMEKSREAKKAREEKMLLEVKALQMQVRVRFFNNISDGQTRKYFEIF